MTVKELKKKLEQYDENKVVIISTNDGWCNLGSVVDSDIMIRLYCDDKPLFDNN